MSKNDPVVTGALGVPAEASASCAADCSPQPDRASQPSASSPSAGAACSEGGAGSQLRPSVTPKMVAAGIRAIRDKYPTFDHCDDIFLEQIVSEVFLAMLVPVQGIVAGSMYAIADAMLAERDK